MISNLPVSQRFGVEISGPGNYENNFSAGNKKEAANE